MSLWAPRETQVRSRRCPRRSRLAVTATAVAGLTARMPSMLTRPAPISSAACWRERARPRRTSSASTRARRVTLTSALLHRFQRIDQDLVRFLEPTSDGVDIDTVDVGDCPGRHSGSWASTASTSARICSGSVFISPFTLADSGAVSTDQRSSAARAVSSPASDR